MKNTLILCLATSLALIPASGFATMSDECYARCDKMQQERDALHDSHDTFTDSGALSKQLDALDDAISLCRAQCGELTAVQDAYRKCIQDAYGDEYLIGLCRENYMKDRPDHSW